MTEVDPAVKVDYLAHEEELDCLDMDCLVEQDTLEEVAHLEEGANFLMFFF